MTRRPTTVLKEIVKRRAAVTVPGAPNALFAKIAEDLGFEAVYVTGAGVANMSLGLPDLGLATATELAGVVSAVADAVSIPVIADIDTGFGNPLNVVRTIQVFERAGASGVQIEDQLFPKKCGHFSGTEIIPLTEMLQKIHACVDARRDSDLQVIARTDARASEGLSAAIDRAHSFREAGADVVFVEAPLSIDEVLSISREIDFPQMVNIVFGGRTPEIGRDLLVDEKISIVLYANAALQAAVFNVQEVLSALKVEGSLESCARRLVTFEERQRIVSKNHWDRLRNRYD